MPFKRAVVLLFGAVGVNNQRSHVSMPFKRAVVLLFSLSTSLGSVLSVSMPFKRAVVLLSQLVGGQRLRVRFQCPLSGQLCCCQPRSKYAQDPSGFNAL